MIRLSRSAVRRAANTGTGRRARAEPDGWDVVLVDDIDPPGPWRGMLDALEGTGLGSTAAQSGSTEPLREPM